MCGGLEFEGGFKLGLQAETSSSMQTQAAVLCCRYPVRLVATVPIMSENTVSTLLFLHL